MVLSFGNFWPFDLFSYPGGCCDIANALKLSGLKSVQSLRKTEFIN